MKQSSNPLVAKVFNVARSVKQTSNPLAARAFNVARGDV